MKDMCWVSVYYYGQTFISRVIMESNIVTNGTSDNTMIFDYE